MSDSKMLVTLTTEQFRDLVSAAVVDALADFSAPEQPSDLFTRSEAASFLRISLATLDRLARDAGLPFVRLGDSRRFIRADLIAWLTTHTHTDTQKEQL